jgi:hypothetical protein
MYVLGIELLNEMKNLWILCEEKNGLFLQNKLLFVWAEKDVRRIRLLEHYVKYRTEDDKNKSDTPLIPEFIVSKVQNQRDDASFSAKMNETSEKIKGIKNQNLRDHMSEAELIFTALAELSTRQIAESENATGLEENKKASKVGGKIAKSARLELESKTGKKVVTSENYLPPSKTKQTESKKKKKKV